MHNPDNPLREWTFYRAKVASLDRAGRHAEANAYRRDLEAAKIRDAARKIAAEWPTLTPDQRAAVAAALPPLDPPTAAVVA